MVMTWEDELQDIRNHILYYRERLNTNNPDRTDYYLQYWIQNPEVPWTLLAHLVSRNAGYQMSDLGSVFVPTEAYSRTFPWNYNLAPRVAVAMIRATWAFLEVGNYLIFRDVFPQLEVYRAAKQYADEPDHSNALFNILLEHSENPKNDLSADPFAVNAWKEFFAAGRAEQWSDGFKLNWANGTAIQRHSFSLIINEQNQIEDRLVNDPEAPDRYLGNLCGGLGGVAPDIAQFIVSEVLEQTSLCFPIIRPSISDLELALYKVSGFQQLTQRIRTGRELYVQLFTNKPLTARVQAWVLANPHHRGTRVDYNPMDFSLSVSELLPGGQTYSPPLKRLPEHEAVWYTQDLKRTRFYDILHSPPVPLPLPVETRTARDPSLFDHRTLLAPLPDSAIVKRLTFHAPSERAEVLTLEDLFD